MSENDARLGNEAEQKTVTAVDLFCGAGGFSEGLRQAADELGFDLRHAAVNHWDRAVETHKLNHPDAHQYQSKVEQLHPPDVVKRLSDDETVDVDLLVGGPSCTHFSRARGGKPVDEQLRMSPWHVLHWLELLDVDAFIIENVPEIQDWGPVDDEGQPTRDGSIFDAWTNALNSLGYAVDWTQLVAADYGDPTSRERFFIVGRQSGAVSFPDPTHGDEPDLPDHRTAAEIIDWSDLGTSIWTRDLTENRVHSPPKNSTMRRIAEGIRRHCDGRLKQFADVLEQIGNGKEDEPMPYTVQNLRDRIVPYEHADTVASAVDDPFLVAVPGHSDGADTMLLRQQDGAHPIDVDDVAVPTIPTRGAHAIATPTARSLVMPKNGSQRGLHSNPLYQADDQLVHTVTSDPRAKLVTPSLLRWSHGGATLEVDDPMPTIATEKGGVFSLSQPYLSPLYNPRPGQRPRTRAIDRPLMTVPGSKSPAALTTPQITPFIDDYEGPAKSVHEPLGTVTSKDRFALCIPELWPWSLDIKYRMLQPDELKQAQGFPADYEIAGTKSDRTEQIGNAVPVHLAKALCEHVLTAQDPSLATYGAGIREDDDVEIPDYHEVAADGGRSLDTATERDGGDDDASM